jgi:RNA polymerase sigma-70 factor (ECF subfamily)
MKKGFNKTEDIALIKEIVKGSQKAFTALFNKYYMSVYYAILIKVKGDVDLAKDIVLEAFEKAHINIEKYNTQYAFSTWIHRIAHNQFLDNKKCAKGSKRTVAFSKLSAELNSHNEGVNEIEFNSNESNPLESLMTEQKIAEIKAAFDSIENEKIKETFRLRIFEGMSYEEIQEELGLSLSVVKTYIFTARKLMAKILVR